MHRSQRAIAAGEPRFRRLTGGARPLRGVNYLGIAFALLAIVLMELASKADALSKFLPGPWPVARTFVRALFVNGTLSDQVGTTLKVFIGGLAISTMLGVAIGLARGLSRRVDEALALPTELLRPLPAVALIPLLILVLGLGSHMRMAAVAYSAVWPILINTYYGVHDADPQAIDVAKNFGLSRLAILRRIVLPSALPKCLTGIRVAAAMALTLTVVTEMIAGTNGLGYVIALAEQSGDTALIYAGVVFVGLIGYLVNLLGATMERRVLFWSPAMRRGA